MLGDIDLTTSDSKEGVHSLLPSNHKCTPSACIVAVSLCALEADDLTLQPETLISKLLVKCIIMM